MLGKKEYNKKYLIISILSIIFMIGISVQPIFATEYTIKLAGVQPIDSIIGKSELLFKEIIEYISDGEIQVKHFPSSQLGSQSDITDGVKMGAIEMAWCWYETVNKKYSIIQMPFLFESWEQANNVIKTSPLMEKYKEEAKQNGYYVLGVMAETPRNITNNVRPIEKPDDLKGLILRVPPMDVMQKSMQYLGASPQSMALGDLYMALKQGVIDGQENPLFQIEAFKFYEVQKYLSLVKYSLFPGVLCMNLEFFESLPYEYQKLVEFAAQASTDYFITRQEVELQECEDFLREHMIVNEITPENHQLFVEKLQPLWQEYIDNGYFSQEDIDQVLKLQ